MDHRKAKDVKSGCGHDAGVKMRHQFDLKALRTFHSIRGGKIKLKLME